MKYYRHWLTLLSCAQLLGCATSAPQYYPNTLNKNLKVNLTLAEAGPLSKINVIAGINEMVDECSSQYLGVVHLKPGVNNIGLAPGKTTDLVVVISRRGYFESALDIKRQVLIKPMTGKEYELAVNYVDNMFDIRLFEVNKTRKSELSVAGPKICRAD